MHEPASDQVLRKPGTAGKALIKPRAKKAYNSATGESSPTGWRQRS